MKFKAINWNEVTQTNNDKYCMFTLICECTIYDIHMCAIIQINTEVPTKGQGRRKDVSKMRRD